MAKRKWRKPTKEEVKKAVQYFLLIYTIAEGFFFVYTFAWFILGLPQTWWALLTTTVLGLLSTFGLLHWIARN